jgi:hypothetical protein
MYSTYGKYCRYLYFSSPLVLLTSTFPLSFPHLLPLPFPFTFFLFPSPLNVPILFLFSYLFPVPLPIQLPYPLFSRNFFYSSTYLFYFPSTYPPRFLLYLLFRFLNPIPRAAQLSFPHFAIQLPTSTVPP